MHSQQLVLQAQKDWKGGYRPEQLPHGPGRRPLADPAAAAGCLKPGAAAPPHAVEPQNGMLGSEPAGHAAQCETLSLCSSCVCSCQQVPLLESQCRPERTLTVPCIPACKVTSNASRLRGGYKERSTRKLCQRTACRRRVFGVQLIRVCAVVHSLPWHTCTVWQLATKLCSLAQLQVG